MGSLNYDLILSSDRLPRAGETITDAVLTESCGGKGANQAVAAARFGGRLADTAPAIAFAGAVGKDLFGRRQIEQLERDGIDTRFVLELDDISTGTSTIWLEKDSAENRILNAPGANGRFLPESLEGLPFAEASLLLIQNEIPVSTTAALSELAAAHDLPMMWDPAPFSSGDPLPLEPERVQILTPNETEAAAILGRPLRLEAVEDEARSLRDLGFGTVVITLGAAGVAVADREGRSYRVEAPVVNAVDSTAAGDAFSGALAACLIADLDEVEAIRRGVEYASEAVCRPGAQSSFPLS